MKYSVLIFLSLFLYSCGGDDDGGGGRFGSCDSDALTNAIEDEFNAFETAASAYASDPSEANCNAWKSAGTAYINAADDYVQDCDNITPAEYDVAVQGALNALATLPCN